MQEKQALGQGVYCSHLSNLGQRGINQNYYYQERQHLLRMWKVPLHYDHARDDTN